MWHQETKTLQTLSHCPRKARGHKSLSLCAGLHSYTLEHSMHGTGLSTSERTCSRNREGRKQELPSTHEGSRLNTEHLNLSHTSVTLKLHILVQVAALKQTLIRARNSQRALRFRIRCKQIAKFVTDLRGDFRIQVCQVCGFWAANTGLVIRV